jgi:hypothetical protein
VHCKQNYPFFFVISFCAKFWHFLTGLSPKKGLNRLAFSLGPWSLAGVKTYHIWWLSDPIPIIEKRGPVWP